MASIETSTWTTKVGLARMLSGGVIMDVVTADHARIAQEAGAVAVVALERVPSDIRKFGGVARMSDPKLIEEIKGAVSIPVMAKCRIGHVAEAQILQQLGLLGAEQVEGTPDVTDVEWLVILVEDQDRCVEQSVPPWRG